MGQHSPHSTLPLNLHVPNQGARETSHNAKWAFKGQVERRPRKRSSRVIQDQVKKDKSIMKGHWKS